MSVGLPGCVSFDYWTVSLGGSLVIALFSPGLGPVLSKLIPYLSKVWLAAISNIIAKGSNTNTNNINKLAKEIADLKAKR